MVAFRVNLVTNVVVGMSNTVFEVILMMCIEYENDKVHSLLCNVVVTCFVIYSFFHWRILFSRVLPCPAL